MKKIKDSHKKEIAYGLTLITQIGISMVCSIGVGFFIGKFLDDFFSTSPVFLIVFIIFGVFAAFKNMFAMVEKSWKE